MYGCYWNASYNNDILIDLSFQLTNFKICIFLDEAIYEWPLYRNIISICDSIGVSSYAVVWGLLEDTQFTENKLGSDPIFMVNLFE